MFTKEFRLAAVHGLERRIGQQALEIDFLKRACSASRNSGCLDCNENDYMLGKKNLSRRRGIDLVFVRTVLMETSRCPGTLP